MNVCGDSQWVGQDRVEPCSSFFVSGWIFVVFTDRTSGRTNITTINTHHHRNPSTAKHKIPWHEARLVGADVDGETGGDGGDDGGDSGEED